MQEGSRTYRTCTRLVSFFLRAFFRRIEVAGLQNLPASGGGLFIAWHPNALVDGALILTQFPGHIVVAARHGLFRWPLLGWLMRSVGSVPVYRRRDLPDAAEEERREANQKSIDAMARAVREGSFALLFPEGQSHGEPYPTELKTGAARLYHRARELAEDQVPVIVPVGLHYDRKHLFGSSALVTFHPPLELDGELGEALPPDATREERRHRYRKLTGELERALHEVVHATESWDLHHAMHRARKLFRAERARRAGASPGRPDMKERILAFSRLWAGYNTRARSHPDEVGKLFSRVRQYDAELRALGIEDHELYANKALVSTRLVLNIVLQAVLVYLVLPPILLIGYVVNLPAAALVWVVSKWGSREKKDEASLKVVTGAIAFPGVWLVAAVLVAWGEVRLKPLYPDFPEAPLLTGACAFVLSAVGAFVALHYQRLARQTLHGIRVRLTRWRRSRTVERLRAERVELYNALRRLAKGLDLPGVLSADGRVHEADPTRS